MCRRAAPPQVASKQRQKQPEGARGGFPPMMSWHDGICLSDAQAALLATVNALYDIPAGERSLPHDEALAAQARLVCGDGGARA